MSGLRQRAHRERLFWMHWTPTYLRRMRQELSVWKAARRYGALGIVAWVIVVVRSLAGRRREIIRNGR